MESTRVRPVAPADVAGGRGAEGRVAGKPADVDDGGEDDEADDGGDFDEGEGEFGFAVAFDAEEVDDDDQHQEDGDENGFVELVVPVADCYGGCDEFEGEDC